MFYQRERYLSPFMPSTFLLTLGDPLRMVLDNAVKGIPLLTAARESIEDFSTFSSSLPVRFYFCFYLKYKEFQLEEQSVTSFFML
jgi:hypothetical protein